MSDISEHKDDSYGSCVICREWVPHTDEDWVPVKWPCAVVREARLRRIEEAARALIAAKDTIDGEDNLPYVAFAHQVGRYEDAFVALRAALEEKPQDRGEVRLPPADPSIVGTEYGPLKEKP